MSSRAKPTDSGDTLSNPSEFADILNLNNEFMVELMRFLNQHELKSDDPNQPNYVSLDDQYRKRFLIPSYLIGIASRKFQACIDAGVTLRIAECPPIVNTDHLQFEDINRYIVGYGLSFDFSFDTNSNQICFEDVVQQFLKILFDEIIIKFFIIPGGYNEYHCALLNTNQSEYDETKKMYQRKYRILIPSIQVHHSLHHYIFDKLVINENLNSYFYKTIGQRMNSLNYHTRNCFKPIVGGTINDLFALNISNVYKVVIDNFKLDEQIKPISSFEKVYTNIINEFSLLYEAEDGIIKKRLYLPAASLCAAIKRRSTSEQTMIHSAYSQAVSEIEKKSIYDDSFDQLKTLLSILSTTRGEDMESLYNVISALSSKGESYHCLAYWFYYNRHRTNLTISQFNEIWENALNNRSKSCDLKSIRYWAMHDDPSAVQRHMDLQVRTMLLRDLKCEIANGTIGNNHIAAYVEYIFQNVFATHAVNKNIIWYEFKTPTSLDTIRAQWFKWVKSTVEPASLIEYISTNIKEIGKGVLLELKHEQNQVKGDSAKEKYFHNLVNTFCRSLNALNGYSFVRASIGASVHKFANISLVSSMDKTKNIMGVGNGVLEFDGPNVRLLDHYHSYPITMYTDTVYKPYDAEDPDVKMVYKMLYSLFPSNELDAMDFILYYLSTSLDWLPKESLFLIITGHGCHALNTPIRMFDGSVKMVQDIDIGELVMGDDNTPRSVQELFRGNEEMIRITTYKGDSFEVNMNHVLSLKFGELVFLEERDDDYIVEWFELNDVREPTKHQDSFASKYDAENHIFALRTNIRMGDIIDIKVNDLLKWDIWWMQYVSLYTSNQTIGFSIERIGTGDYYGFELDGNHRYKTQDGIVHHNSNGKSILIEFFREVLGEQYARRMPLSFITEQTRSKSASADPATMEMKYARFINYSESENNERANIARIKEMTGGDTMSARPLYGEQENFKPNCNHLLATNHHLRIESTEHAVWRRFITYRFKMTFKDNPNQNSEYERKKDPAFINMLKDNKRYHTAFLAILVHYRSKLYSEYKGQILMVPRPTIIAETDVYRQQEDIFERFILQCVFYKQGKAIQTLNEFMSAFRRFYLSENNERFNMKNEDMTHIFTNSSIAKYIVLGSNGLYVLNDLYVPEDSSVLLEGSVLYKEVLKTMREGVLSPADFEMIDNDE